MKSFESTLTSLFGNGLWSVIKAVLLLIVAFIVAAIVKAIIVKLLNKTKLGEMKTAADPDGKHSEAASVLIGKLAYLIVFLLFVPGIFECLGLTDVSTPILNVLETIWGYLPNVLGAALILWIGFYVAKLVRELLIPLFNKLEVNKLQKLAGIETDEAGKLSNTLAYLVYVLILIPVIITALQVLNIKAISDPAIEMLNVIFTYIPRILAALIIIMVGWVLAKFIGNIVTRLIEASGLDSKVSKLLGTSESTGFVLSDVIGKTIQVVLVIFFVVESFASLNLAVLTNVGNAIIAYMPYVLAAVIIFAICYVAADLCAKVLAKHGHAAAGMFVKCVIYTLGAFMILNELGIAKTLVNGAFILIVAGLAVAFAIAYGVGGRDFAKNSLAKLQSKLDKAEENKAE